ncbi:uncharacterized protein LOC109523234 isoform X1 [Hippocampus comes]|uniref:uncharacterized protein LOC109523234 isoform X1 n=2 Tax=Hippocampus comes TaxID=109280 RepID=UPI00094F06C0|nr:PREDICTED: uncharacterized protein LOC109523234 isoform X1 [Hippocampus comes]
MEGVQPFVSLIEFYFEIGLKYKDIKSVLDVKYGFQISERHLKRVLNQRGLFRRKTFNDLGVLVDFIRNQLQHSGQLHGYRWMYSKCREYGLLVRKEDVRLVLKELDPRGVSLRQARRLRRRNYFSKGPNFIWHMDSYDKLKPFGICINGAIDGFSRKIMWLNAYTTSSDPKLIGGYYIEVVHRLGGCPRIVRADLGTENGHVKGFQRFLVPIPPGNTLDSYLDGASTANQRIEYWWRFLRSQCMEFWLSLFTDLRDNGFFDGGFLDKNILQFCCMGLIQDELDDMALVWNSHLIRPSKNMNVPSGRPNVMYTLPELYGTRDFLSPVDDEQVQLCKSQCVFRLTMPCDPDVFALCAFLMSRSDLMPPKDPYQAVNLYLHLRAALTATL